MEDIWSSLVGGRERISSKVIVGVGGYQVEYEDMWWDVREDTWWDGSLGGYLVSSVSGVGGYLVSVVYVW